MPELLSLLGILLALLLVLAGSYLFTRWAGRGLSSRFGLPGGGHVVVQERVTLGRDQSLLVVQVADRYFLLGSSSSGLTLLAELTQEEGGLWHTPPDSEGTAQKPDFRALLKGLREKK